MKTGMERSKHICVRHAKTAGNVAFRCEVFVGSVVCTYLLRPENIRKRKRTADSTKACSPWELICRDGPMMLANRLSHFRVTHPTPGADLTRCEEQFWKYLAMSDELTEDVFLHPSAEKRYTSAHLVETCCTVCS